MLDLIFIPLLLIYFGILTCLFLYGANFLHLTLFAIFSKRPEPLALVPGEWPHVTVQLPVYNEMYVARRLIDAAAGMDYPAGKLTIQVLDDSTDETTGIVEEAARYWRQRGIDVQHVRRSQRTGFKAGALAYGMTLTGDEYLAMFDADFIPSRNFLKRTVPVLNADTQVAFVQTRWGHINAKHSLLTRLQSLSIDGHFAIEQYSRWRAGYFFNFNGTAGVWRRQALNDAGGWTADTLTEDLDISYRAFMRGWRAVYLRDVESPSELPVSMEAYRKQQFRWARGSLQCAIKHVPAIWRTDTLTRWRKVQGTMHLTGYVIHILMLLLAFLYPLLLLVSTRYPSLLSLFGFLAVFNFAGLAPGVLFAAGQHQLGRSWWKRVPLIILLSPLGAGMMLNTARAGAALLSHTPGTFERTPKFGTAAGSNWRQLRYRTRVDLFIVLELGLAVINFGTAYYALHLGVWSVAFYTGLFGCGLASIAIASVSQSLGGGRPGADEPQPVQVFAGSDAAGK